MPISVVCSGCQRKLKAPDSAAGKRTKCPACQSVIEIPAGGAASGKDSWTMQTGGGESFGPVTKAELDQWVKEGRLDDNCQLLQEGAPQWQWASDVYPQLSQQQASQPAQAAADPFGQTPANPFDQSPAQSSLGQPAQQMGMQPMGQVQQPGFGSPSFPAQSYPAQPYSMPAQSAYGSANPYAPSSVATRAQAGDAAAGIVTIAVFNFVLSGMHLLCGLFSTLAAVGFAAITASMSEEGTEGAEVAGGILFIVFIIVAILQIAFGVMLLMGGVGLLKRQNWGRVLTLVCAGLAGLAAAFNIFGIISGSWTNLISLLMNGGYCISAYIVLLSSGANRAFRKRR